MTTPLTQCGSRHVPLPDCPRHLIRLRPNYSPKKQWMIGILAKQCESYRPGNTYLARRMIETMERIEGKR